MPQYILRTYTDDEGTDWDMYEAQYATKGPATGQRWYLCTICGEAFPKSKMSFKGSTPYCIPNRCYLEKNSPQLKGQI